MSNLKPFIIAFAFAIIAVVLVYVYIQNIQNKTTTTEIKMAPIARATVDIQPRTTIKSDMIEEVEVPESLVTADNVTEMDEIIGKVSVTAIYKNQPLLNQMFREETEMEDLARRINEGERAVTVGVTEVSGLGGNLAVGDKVDVLVTVLNNEEVGVPSTFTVLRNIDVMAVGQDIGFSDGGEEGMTATPISKSVTLRVLPSQAEILSLASEIGSLRLALRDPDDEFAPATEGTALTEFTKYTPTRKDLEEMAKQAQQEAEAARERENQARIAMIQAQAAAGNAIGPEFLGPEVGELPPVGPPPILVELILGGQSQIVQLQRPQMEE